MTQSSTENNKSVSAPSTLAATNSSSHSADVDADSDISADAEKDHHDCDNAKIRRSKVNNQ